MLLQELGVFHDRLVDHDGIGTRRAGASGVTHKCNQFSQIAYQAHGLTNRNDSSAIGEKLQRGLGIRFLAHHFDSRR